MSQLASSTRQLGLLALVLVCVSLASSGCLRSTTFNCDDNSDCGGGGTCEVAEGGYCSFSDPSCTVSMRRFGDHSGAKSNQCVGETGGVDGGIDSPMGDGGIDAPPTGCKGNYMALANSGPRGHKYRLLPNNGTWVQQRDACAADQAFLAFPDGAALADAQAELAALTTLAGNGVWIGVTDQLAEGTYRTSLNMPASAITLMLLVGSGGNSNGQDCLAGTGMTLTDEDCNGDRKAVCECVP
ncbi:MAG: C-type lectin domain-containing protein [Deltaproteobacteria bacterium]|nr:C-type lectin domain-containing protein [Deltaproteobacteria bacterium]MDQ3298325.1 C-type lectin domain-containing protein [Myxococcota bacterium]